MGSQDRAGYAVAVMLILSVIGAAWAFGNLDREQLVADPSTAPIGSPTPVPTPAPLPTTVQVGVGLDPDTGQVADEAVRFQAGETIAFSMWLGAPVGVDQVRVQLARVEPAGPQPAGEAQPVAVDSDALYVAGELDADLLLELVGAGTYLFDVVLPDDERLGSGAFQLEVSVPEDIEAFPEGTRQVAIGAGEHVGIRFDAAGEIVEEKAFTLGADSGAPAGHRAVYGGRAYVFMVKGVWDGFYLPESESVRVLEPQVGS